MERRRKWGNRLGIGDVAASPIIIKTFEETAGSSIPEESEAYRKLLVDPDPYDHLQAARIIELMIGEPAFETIREVLTGYYPPGLRKAAVQALGDTAGTTPAHAYEALEKLLLSESDAEILVTAIHAAGRFAPDMKRLFVPVLVRLLRNPASDVFCTACHSLGALGGEAVGAIAALVANITRGQIPDVNHEAARALVKIVPLGLNQA